MNFKYYERMIVFGETQSGKTHFARFLCKNLTRLIVYDIFKKNFSTCGVVVRSWDEFETAFRKNTPKIIVQWEDPSVATFEKFCGYLFDNYKHGTVIVDEIQEFCDANYTPENLRKLVVMGQEEPRRIGVVSITQLPAQMSTKLRGNAQHKISFYLCEKNAIKACRESGFNALADELPKLERYHWVYCNPGNRVWEIRKPISS